MPAPAVAPSSSSAPTTSSAPTLSASTTPVAPIPQPASEGPPPAQSDVVGLGKRPRANDDSAEATLMRKTKWQKILEVMKRDVVTRKVSKDIDNYHEQARLIPRIVNPFIDPLAALMLGRARELPDADLSQDMYSDSDSDEELDEAQLLKRKERRDACDQRCELLSQYNALLNLLPDLDTDIALLDDDDIDTLAAYIKHDAGKARTTDFNHVTEHIWQYLAKTDYFENPPSDLEKWQCGWEGFVTGFLLCPPPLRHEFKQDWEKFCDKVKDATSDITIVSDDWPIVLFDLDAVSNEIKRHGPLTGFLQSDMFRMMVQSLWTGPISAKRDGARAKSTPGRPPLSHKYNIDSVTPRMLAYVAVLLRHALTTAEWNITDLQFNNSHFFDKIVTLFEEPMSLWASETLEWWDTELFGIVPRTEQANPGRKTIAEEARDYQKAVRRAMKAGLDPAQVLGAKDRTPVSPPADQSEHSHEPVASSSTRRPSAGVEEDADLESQPGSPLSALNDAEDD